MVVVFLAACLARCLFDVALGLYKNRSRVEMQKIAESISRGHGFGNPFLIPTGPTAHNPPLYPLILAVVFRVFGTGTEGEIAMHVMNGVAASCAYALIPLVVCRLGLPLRVGLLAGLTGALVPIHGYVELRGGEYGFAAVVLETLFLLTLSLRDSDRLCVRRGMLHGPCWGLGLLLFPSLLSVLIGWLALLALRYRRRAATYSLSLIATTICMLSPWAIRNWLVLGKPVFLRSNFGLELQVSNNELAKATIAANIGAGVYRQYHPFTSVEQAREVKRVGEVEYNRRKLEEALSWIVRNPLRFAELAAGRTFLFWFPRIYRPFQSVVISLIMLVALLGWRMMWVRRREWGFQLLGVLWLVYPLVYYLLQTDNRYRYPLLWSILLLASVVFERALARVLGRHQLTADST